MTTHSIIEDFRRARFRADLQSVLSRLTGSSSELLAYDEVRQKLHGVESAATRHQEIPLADIVGSVGRYHDYNRMFLPLKDSDLERWVRVKAAMTGLGGVPPIEVYQVGDAYFVKDGNHRVSVARQLGAKTIDAYVREVQIDVPFSPSDRADDLIIKAEYADFLEQTRLRRLRPEAELFVTAPGQYEPLLEHIRVHQYFMGLERRGEVSFEEAVAHWYDAVYLPVVALLRERGLMQDFPERTPTDLYLWLADYRAKLEQDLGWSLSADAVTASVVEARQPRAREALAILRNPRELLLRGLLVAINGAEAGWRALEQAIPIARREGVQLYGLHVIGRAENEPDADAVRQEFARRCQEAGVQAQLAVEVGGVVSALSERARWTDLVVAPLSFPPGQADFKLGGGFQALLRRTPRPILAAPGGASPLSRPLLAYNGTAKATFALFAAAYLAARWGAQLSVVTVSERGKADQAVLEGAQRYLEGHGVEADYQLLEGPIAPTLLECVARQGGDLLIVGSYEYPSLLEPLLGGVLDELLRKTETPMLICQ